MPFGVKVGPVFASTGRTGCGSFVAGFLLLCLAIGAVVVYWYVVVPVVLLIVVGIIAAKRLR